MSFQSSHSIRFFTYRDLSKVDRDLLIFDRLFKSIKGTGHLEAYSYCHPTDPDTQDSVSFEGLYYSSQRREFKKINPRIKKARIKKALDQYRKESGLKNNQKVPRDERELIETLIIDQMAIKAPVGSAFSDFIFVESPEKGQGLLFCEEQLKGGRLYDLVDTANVNVEAFNPLEGFIEAGLIAKETLLTPSRFNTLFLHWLFIKILKEEAVSCYLYGEASLVTDAGIIKISGDAQRIKEELKNKTVSEVKSLELAISPVGPNDGELRPIKFTLKSGESLIYGFKNPYGARGEGATFAIEKAHELSNIFLVYRTLFDLFKADVTQGNYSVVELGEFDGGSFE